MIYYTYTYRHELRDRIAKSGEQNKSASSEVYEQQLWELVARLNAAERSKYTLVAAVFDGAVAYTDATAKAADVPMTAWRAQAAAALSALTIAKHECTVLDARWTKTSSGAKIARTHSRLVTASLPRWAPLHAVREGLLWKESRGVLGSKLLARWFTLRGGVLAYQSDKAPHEISTDAAGDAVRDSPFDEVASLVNLDAVKLVETATGLAFQLHLSNNAIADDTALAKKGGTMQLRAATPGETRAWAKCLNEQIDLLRSIKTCNSRCADCDVALSQWLCLPADGIAICGQCADAHRAERGVTARSLTSQQWSVAELSLLKQLGNERGEALWQSPTQPRPSLQEFERNPVELRREWIRRKYVEREFVDDDGAPAAQPTARVFGMPASDPFSSAKVSVRGCGERLVVAASDGKYADIVKWRERGGDINFRSERESLRTPLHAAAISDDELAATLLINSGAALSVVDAELKTPMQLAPKDGAVHRLLALTADENSHDPIFVAVLWQAPPTVNMKGDRLKSKSKSKKQQSNSNSDAVDDATVHGVDGEWTIYRLDDTQPLSFLVAQLEAQRPGAHVCLSDQPLLELPPVSRGGRFYVALVLPVVRLPFEQLSSLSLFFSPSPLPPMAVLVGATHTVA